ncbi:MAG: hypothetical protein JXA46_07160 [Dehalococcoidales bacterium]|nr:hypothetical protein [Dehalococcoidales bacterium]
MAIIRSTTKLLNELGVKPTNTPDQPPDLFDWHANLLRLNRKKYVLYTNSQTLYSILMRWAGKAKNFQEQFRLELFKNLMSEGFNEKHVEYMMSGHAQVTITQTNSRSVLGSMNDLAIQIGSMISLRGRLADPDLPKINREMNRIPMGAIKYQYSIAELKRKLDDIHT